MQFAALLIETPGAGGPPSLGSADDGGTHNARPRRSAVGTPRCRLRAAIVAPPSTSVPPRGGIEAVVDQLAVGLQQAGHEVVLFTVGESTFLVPRQSVLPRAEGDRIGDVVPELCHVVHAYDAVKGFDLVHDHTILGPVYAERFPELAVVSTIHGPIDAQLADLYRRVSHRVDLIAISNAQAASAPELGVSGVIPNGIDLARFPEGRNAGGYCAFLGRMCADKGAHPALQVARRAGVNLVLAGKMRTQAERDYFEAEVKPQLGERTWYVGEVSQARKLQIVANAWCLLFSIRWPGSFGLVMIESLACGTPVRAFPEGPAPEVIEHGRTGYLCQDEAEVAEAVVQVDNIERRACRRAVEARFSTERMVGEHVELFHEVAARRGAHRPRASAVLVRGGGPGVDLGVVEGQASAEGGREGTPQEHPVPPRSADCDHTMVTDHRAAETAQLR